MDPIWNLDFEHDLEVTFHCMSCSYKTTNDRELTHHVQKNHLDKIVEPVEPERDLDEERNSSEYTTSLSTTDESSEDNDLGKDVDPDWKSKSKLKLKSKISKNLKKSDNKTPVVVDISKSKSKLKSKSQKISETKSDNKTPVVDERTLKERCLKNKVSVLIRKEDIPQAILTAQSKSTPKSQTDSNSNQNEVTMPSMPSTSHNNNLPNGEWEEFGGDYLELSEKISQILRISVNEPGLDMNVQKNHLDKIVEPVEPECDLDEERNVESAAPFQGMQNEEVVEFFEATENLWTVWEQIKNSERDKKFFNSTAGDGISKQKDRSAVSWANISNNGFLQFDVFTENRLLEFAMNFLNHCHINLPEFEMEQYARLVLMPQVQVHLLMEKYEISEEKAEDIFKNYRAPTPTPEDEMEENLQMAQAPTFVETIEEDDVPDFDHYDSENNTGEVFEPDVGAPTYVLDGQVPSTSRDMDANAKNLNLLQVIDLSDFKRPKVFPKKSRKGGKNTYKKNQCPEIKKTCIECKQIFADRSGLIKHLRFNHRESNGYSKFIHQCQFCDESSESRKHGTITEEVYSIKKTRAWKKRKKRKNRKKKKNRILYIFYLEYFFNFV